jgi:general nucleoside transport system permease protein
MNLRLRWSSQREGALIFAILIALAMIALLSYKVYGLSSGMSPNEMWDTIKASPDYQNVFVVNLLIGISVLLMIIQLRWAALRVLLTVGIALVLGYLMTAFFNLDASVRLTRGEFRLQVLSAAEPLTNIKYGDELTSTLNDPKAEPPLTEATYRFAGRQGDVVSIAAYSAKRRSDLNMQVSLLDSEGNVLQENQDAPQDLRKGAFRRYLQSDGDALIANFTLPAEGIYSIVAKPEPDSATMQEDFNVTLISDNTTPVDIAYNGDPVGAAFNAEKDEEPLKRASYKFVGRQGDVVSIFTYALREVDKVDLELSLTDSAGKTVASAKNSTDTQHDTFKPFIKSSRDAIIENFTLPADGIYTITIQPEPVSLSTKLSEMFSATNKAYDSFLLGPLSRINRWITWIRDAITLIMAGLAIAIVFRAEQFSLGAEGQIYLGALVSGVIGLSFGDVPKTLLVPIALLSAATVGFLWGLIPGVLKAYLGANELVSTLMLNTIATRFYEMVLLEQFKPPEAGGPYTNPLSPNALLHPIIDVGGDQVSIAVYLLIGLVLLTWLLIQRTPIGYEIRMIGSNIKFTTYGGVNTKRTIMLAMAISGAIAGLAGAHLAMGIQRKLLVGISSGLAFEGVVVALLARNDPLVVPFTGLLYAYLRTGAQMMEQDTDVSSEVVRIIQAVVILLITAEALVTFFQRRRQIRRRGTLELDLEPDKTPPPPVPAEGGAHG